MIVIRFMVRSQPGRAKEATPLPQSRSGEVRGKPVQRECGCIPGGQHGRSPGRPGPLWRTPGPATPQLTEGSGDPWTLSP
jgi:hypothetical protein